MPAQPFVTNRLSVRILYPPAYVNGRLNKGAMILSQVDQLVARFPRLKQLFFIAETRGWRGMNVSQHADIKLTEDASTAEQTRARFPNAIVLPIGKGDFVDPDLFRPLGLPCPYDAIQISRWREFKRHELFIRAAAELPDMKFVHLGHFAEARTPEEREYQDNCLRLADAIAPNLEFPFRDARSNDELPLDPHEVNRWINRAKIGVLTSSVEGLPRFKLECLAADRPFLVAHDAPPPVKIYVNERSGAFFEPNPTALAAAIRDVIGRLHTFTPREALLSVTGKARAEAMLKDALRQLCRRHGQQFNGESFSFNGRNEDMLWGQPGLELIERTLEQYPDARPRVVVMLSRALSGLRRR